MRRLATVFASVVLPENALVSYNKEKMVQRRVCTRAWNSRNSYQKTLGGVECLEFLWIVGSGSYFLNILLIWRGVHTPRLFDEMIYLFLHI